MTKLEEGPISWEDAAAFGKEYANVLSIEYTGHDLVVDKHGTIRWVEDPVQEKAIMDMFGATDLNDLYTKKDVNKNDHLIRVLYKCMGYSLSGFWEIFYWEANNEDAWKYGGRKGHIDKKRIQVYSVIEIDNDTDVDEFMEAFENYLDDGAGAAAMQGGMVHEIVSTEYEE